ncbi:MAG TPA: TlpA disulfide reductase family protein [Kiritimatiellia bacterium]|nr:TlpA disulfide reductase family protein [Kiritimatiellia bacterium]HMP33760.1 TlpA disulfide reductase family protein [Kiritimatiellia bacterium]
MNTNTPTRSTSPILQQGQRWSRFAPLLIATAGTIFLLARPGACPSGGCALTAALAGITPDPVTDASPGWRFTALNGTTYSDESQQGHITVIAYWATWCPPCRKEIPVLTGVHERFRERGVTVLGVSMDELPSETLASKANDLGIAYPVIQGESAPLFFGPIDAIPTLVILDREGRVALRHTGFLPARDLDKAITQLL